MQISKPHFKKAVTGHSTEWLGLDLKDPKDPYFLSTKEKQCRFTQHTPYVVVYVQVYVGLHTSGPPDFGQETP